jgi:CubicO group peptidase (beta-lactamase class C family)
MSRFENRRRLLGASLFAPLAAHGACDCAAGSAAPVAGEHTPPPAAQIDHAIAQLDKLAADLMASSGVPGMAVAVVRGTQTVYAKGFGIRETGAGLPVDADTVFQLASLSKPIGASVIAQQIGTGAIGWDTKVRTHLPWFALANVDTSAALTIGDLYAHRSGLPDHAGDELEDIGCAICRSHHFAARISTRTSALPRRRNRSRRPPVSTGRRYRSARSTSHSA